MTDREDTVVSEEIIVGDRSGASIYRSEGSIPLWWAGADGWSTDVRMREELDAAFHRWLDPEVQARPEALLVGSGFRITSLLAVTTKLVGGRRKCSVHGSMTCFAEFRILPAPAEASAGRLNL
ncbi:MAG: hypothetical protein ABW067_01790 [Rhizobacter sp.]|jgi:hypothetical protein